MKSFVEKTEKLLFFNRSYILALFLLCTLLLGWSASKIKLDTGFEKNIPREHEYMQTFLKHQKDFGGANRIQIAIENLNGDIFNADFFNVLKSVTNELFFLDGVDRSSVASLFTPNTRFIEVVEDGFQGGPVIPADFVATPEGLERVWKNTIKAGVVGRLVANDFSCAMVFAQLMEINPNTGQRLNYIRFAHDLEKSIREKYQTDTIRVHIIGFAKMIGDVADGAKGVVTFFGISILITTGLVYLYALSIQLTLLPIFCSLIAVVWQLGLLKAVGFGLDPMAVLVPFLVFAIGVSHGLQMINVMGNEVIKGRSSFDAARNCYKRLLIPGSIALLTDTVGFLTLLLIKVDIIRELGINASMGVAVVILTNLILLPILMSYLTLSKRVLARKNTSSHIQDRIWKILSYFSFPKMGIVIVVLSACLFLIALRYALNMQIGDLHAGAPALHEDSQYNKDVALIVDRFSIGVDVLSVIVEAEKDACISNKNMQDIDRFHWRMENVPGVQSVISLTSVSKLYNAAFNEGNLKWRIISRDEAVLAQSTARLSTSSGLLNGDCSIIPIYIFTKDHKAQTIDTVIKEAKKYIKNHPSDTVTFRLASGPLGVMAAKNEEVEAAQVPMLMWVYIVIIVLCYLSFRSIKATCCVVIPLIVVSALGQALMTLLGIGLTVYTIPVLAMGVGEGVDYGIYLVTPLIEYIKKGMPTKEAFYRTLQMMGGAVVVTGLTLATGVSTWMFSTLKFQMDIGILLTFVLMLNMIGAITLLPSLASQFWKKNNIAEPNFLKNNMMSITSPSVSTTSSELPRRRRAKSKKSRKARRHKAELKKGRKKKRTKK
ncbi:MAG: RND family transporter [Candidatus Magnetomorum sp.]|nr:RND family transporter [Candidatus Magnetomorum sp.]